MATSRPILAKRELAGILKGVTIVRGKKALSASTIDDDVTDKDPASKEITLQQALDLVRPGHSAKTPPAVGDDDESDDDEVEDVSDSTCDVVEERAKTSFELEIKKEAGKGARVLRFVLTEYTRNDTYVRTSFFGTCNEFATYNFVPRHSIFGTHTIPSFFSFLFPLLL